MPQTFNPNNPLVRGGFNMLPTAGIDTMFPKTSGRIGKQSFLVFKQNKYLTIPTERIAFFHIRFDCSIMVCFDRQEYHVNYSLEQLEHLLPELQFYRMNRQYLVSFGAVKEVEHYFARKLLVRLAVPLSEQLLVSKEKSTSFLRWLENR